MTTDIFKPVIDNPYLTSLENQAVSEMSLVLSLVPSFHFFSIFVASTYHINFVVTEKIAA